MKIGKQDPVPTVQGYYLVGTPGTEPELYQRNSRPDTGRPEWMSFYGEDVVGHDGMCEKAIEKGWVFVPVQLPDFPDSALTWAWVGPQKTSGEYGYWVRARDNHQITETDVRNYGIGSLDATPAVIADVEDLFACVGADIARNALRNSCAS